MALEKKWTHTEKEKKMSDSGRPSEQTIVAIPTELQGQIRAGRGRLKIGLGWLRRKLV